jgi:capsular polysaccharide transport system permease protein
MTGATMDLRLSTIEILRAQWRIIVALMLHDIRSRMGGNAFGFLVMGVAWPLSHILILLGIYAGTNRAIPFGDSAALWFATGIIPYMAFSYMARNIMLGIVLNRPLISFPIVKPSDILFARVIIETLNAGLVIIIMSALALAVGIDFMPLDPVQASLAVLAMMLLGVGFGAVNAVIAALVPFWITGYALLSILMWITSGILFVPDTLPEIIRTPLSFLPYLQGVEWMRSAFYQGYGASILDKQYLLYFALGSLFIGLGVDRALRGKLLQP